AGVSLLVADGRRSYLETDAEGYFAAAASGSTVIIPRQTGYRVVPETQAAREAKQLRCLAYPWPEPDLSSWGPRLSFDSHLDWVETIAFSPDDQYVATGSNDRTIRIWRARDGQLVRIMSGHRNGIKAMAFSPEGRYLASGAADGSIKIWDWQAGQE